MDDQDQRLASVERAVLAWPGVSKEPGRFNSTAYMLGRREIGHVHRNGVADLPFPRAVHDELIASGKAEPHQAGVPGFVSFAVRRPDDVAAVVALFRMNYERALAAAARRGVQPAAATGSPGAGAVG